MHNKYHTDSKTNTLYPILVWNISYYSYIPCREPIAFRINPTRIPPTMANSRVTNKATRRCVSGHFNPRLHSQDSTLDIFSTPDFSAINCSSPTTIVEESMVEEFIIEEFMVD